MDITTLSPQALMANSKQEYCSSCKGLFFIPVLIFRRISKVLTGEPRDSLVPHQVMVCKDCGTPIPDMIPKNLGEEPAPEEQVKEAKETTSKLILE